MHFEIEHLPYVEVLFEICLVSFCCWLEFLICHFSFQEDVPLTPNDSHLKDITKRL